MNKLATLLLLLALLTACQPAANRLSAAADAPAAAAAQGADIQADAVFAEGVLEPRLTLAQAFQSGGVVAEILVAEGDAVAAGDPLLRLDDADAALAREQAQARLNSAAAGLTAAQRHLELAQAQITTAEQQVAIAEAQLALTRSGPLPAEIDAAEAAVSAAEAGITQAAGSRDAALTIATDAAVAAAEANVAAATADRRAVEDQYDTILTTCVDLPDDSEVCPLYGPVEEATRAQLEAARAAEAAAQAGLDQLLAGATPAQQAAANGGVALAIARRDVAQAQLDLLLAGATPAQVDLAEVGVAQAEVAVAQAEVAVQQAEAAVAAAEAEVAAAQVGLDTADAALAKLTLTAGLAGRVARIDVSSGELVAAGTPVITLADDSAWQVTTSDLTELDVAAIAVGETAVVTLEAIPGISLSGTVTEVALTPGQSQGDVVYAVTVALPSAPDLPLRWGMTAFVDVDV